MDDVIRRQDAIEIFSQLWDCIDEIADKEEWEDVCKTTANELPSTNQWIPCSERLPEDDAEVFVYLFERPTPYIAWVEDCRWYTEDFEVEKENYPTAWMPLPKPYKAESEENK